jgi:NADPH:quinone reductase-like Zn-dependent oxidoreductase
MKAIVRTKYGTPDVLQLQEVQIPAPNDDQALVKVHAASVTFSNLLMVTAGPFPIRLLMGLLRPPTPQILGSDIAGQVEAVGKNVKQFQPADQVFGYLADCGKGGYAEYVCAPERALGPKPANLSFEEAAAVPEAALVALQAVRDDGQIQPGHQVLVYGASGGIGTFAVQIAKYFGAEVTGVCSTRNLDLVRSIGADHVIDYTREDFAKSGQRYDLIVATAGYRSLSDYQRALSPSGIYVCTGGSWRQIFQAAARGRRTVDGGRKLVMLTMNPNYDFATLREMIEVGKVRPVIDRCYPLRETAEAFKYYGKRHARGKVVITVANHSEDKG